MSEKQVSVAALMTAPRFEIVWARSEIEHALRQIGVPLTVSGGVFYGQCMQRMLEDVIDKGVDYALTIDFDSVFRGEDAQRLLNIISHEEGIDAIAAIQPMRGSGRVLGAMREKGTVEWDGYPVRVTSAHFGLTTIDLHKLADVPKPWFQSRADDDGRWEGNKIDDDVWFWRQWEKAGNSVFIDPGCRLGHLEEMVSVFDENMQLVHMYPNQWKAQANVRDNATRLAQTESEAEACVR